MKKLLWLIPIFILALPCALFAQTDSASYLAAGNQAYAVKDYLVALLNFQAAVQLDPKNAAAHQCLGSVYYVQGQKEQAWAEFQASLRLNPNNPALASLVQSLTLPTPSPTPPASELALPSMPHSITPVPEIGRSWNSSPTTMSVVPETNLPPLSEPTVSASITVSSNPGGSPAAANLAMTTGMTQSHPKLELDIALGGLASLDGGQGLGWSGSIACYDLVSPDLGLGGSLGFYATNSQVVSNNTYTSVPPSTPSTSPSQEVLNQTQSRFQIFGSAKLMVNGSSPQPYLLAGLGVAFLSDAGTDREIVSSNTLNYHTLPDSTQTCAVGETGLGLKINLAQSLDLFLEGKVDLLLGLNGGTATTYFPFQAGLGFDL